MPADRIITCLFLYQNVYPSYIKQAVQLMVVIGCKGQRFPERFLNVEK